MNFIGMRDIVDIVKNIFQTFYVHLCFNIIFSYYLKFNKTLKMLIYTTCGWKAPGPPLICHCRPSETGRDLKKIIMSTFNRQFRCCFIQFV